MFAEYGENKILKWEMRILVKIPPPPPWKIEAHVNMM